MWATRASLSCCGRMRMKKPLAAVSIWELGLPPRTRNALGRSGVRTLADLAALDEVELLSRKHIGKAAVAHVHAALARWRLALAPVPQAPPSTPGRRPRSRRTEGRGYARLAAEIPGTDETPIKLFLLPASVGHALMQQGIVSVGALASLDGRALSRLPRVGPRGRGAVRRALRAYGEVLRASGAAADDTALAYVRSRLSVRERRVLACRAGLIDGRPWTLQRVANELGITREGARQLQNRALRVVRAWQEWTQRGLPGAAEAGDADEAIAGTGRRGRSAVFTTAELAAIACLVGAPES